MVELLTTREAANILRVSEMHIRNLIKSKRLTGYCEGRKGGYRIPITAIDNYIEEMTNRTMEQY